jgi:phosphate uptake regulator
MGVKDGFREFYKVWKKRDLLRDLFEEAADVLADVERMFDVACDALLRGKEPEFDLDEKDEEVNEAKVKIRKKVVEHLMLNPRKDVVAFLTLIDISRDLERIGDYAKNILWLSALMPQGVYGCSCIDALREMKSDIDEMFDLTRLALENADQDSAEKVVKTYLSDINPRVDGFIERYVSAASQDPQEMVVCTHYVRDLKRIGSHLMDMACTITSSPYHEMKKKRD